MVMNYGYLVGLMSDEYAMALRQAFRQSLCTCLTLPAGSHSNLLSLLLESVNFFHDVCKSSVRFSFLSDRITVTVMLQCCVCLYGMYCG